jgi:hypothetical protein
MVVDPLETSLDLTLQDASQSANQLWGIWDVVFNPETMNFEATPVRGAMFQANVTRFLQPPGSPVHLLTVQIDIGESDIPAGKVACDVTVQHPFVGVAKWRGFDVRGIVMGNATTAGLSGDGEMWPSLNELRVINADGYTRWWNPTEFTTYNTIFGYTPGAKAPVGFYATGTVNGYKYFADGLNPEASMSDLDLASRGGFGVDPGVNTRHYVIQFPLIGGIPSFKFNYAITASYFAPDDSDPSYPLSAFPISANSAEAFRIDVEDDGSSAYFVDSTTYGGDLVLKIEVFDWQLGTVSNVGDEIAGITIESPTLFPDIIDIPLDQALPGSSEYSRIFPVTVNDVTPTGVENQEILVRVLSAHPDNYAPDIPGISGFDFPENARLAAYGLWEAPISNVGPQDNQPPEVGVIDGPNSLFEGEEGTYTLSFATDLEDGTNLTILWDYNGDLDFVDDLDGDSTNLEGKFTFTINKKYEVIARAVDSGDLYTDSAPFTVYVGGCPSEIHDSPDNIKLADAPPGYFSRMDSAFQTVGPYAGQLLIQTGLGEVKRYDITQSAPWTGNDYIELPSAADMDFVYEIDVEDFSGRVILSMMNASPTFGPGWFQVYDNLGNQLASISTSTGPTSYVSAFDTDENGDLWVSTWEDTDPAGGHSYLRHYVYQESEPYYVEDEADRLDTTEQFQAQSEVWDIAVSYTLRRIYAFRGNYNQGIAKHGEMYVYDIAPDGTLTYNAGLTKLEVFPNQVMGSYNNFYGVLVDGKVDIDHVNESSEYCRIIAMAQRDPYEGSGHYFEVMDSDLNIIDDSMWEDNIRRYAFSIGVDPDPANRPIITSGFNDTGKIQLSPAPPGY